jgi:hypothetical protein
MAAMGADARRRTGVGLRTLQRDQVQRREEGMRILALDPSSTCTGYAILDDGRVKEAGRLRGKTGLPPDSRVLAMRDGLREVLMEHRPAVVVVELPVEKQYTTTPGKKSGFAVWGLAAGAIWTVAVDWAENECLAGGPGAHVVHRVSNTLWTRGKSKDDRRIVAKGAMKEYDPANDPGGDMSDAIALGLWWWAESRAAEVKKMVRP